MISLSSACVIFVARAADVHERRKPWVPLMMQPSYRPNGWLGIMLGSRLYYEFTEAALGNAEDWKRIADSVAQEVRRRGGAQAVAGARPQEAVAVAVAAAAAAAPAVPTATVSPPMREAAAGVSVSSATTNTSIFNNYSTNSSTNASTTSSGNTSIVLL